MTATASLTSFPERLTQLADRAPDVRFLSDTSGTHLTHAQLLQAVLSRASTLAQLDLSPGDTLAVQLPSTLDTVCTWLATAWLRATYAPININHTGSMLAQQINRSGARVAMTTPTWARRFVDILPDSPSLRLLVIDDDDPASHPESLADRLPECVDVITMASLRAGAPRTTLDLNPPGINEISSLVFTSGTTGPSKGVLVPWGQWAHSNLLDDLDEPLVYYCPFPLYHASGHISLIFMAETGGRVVLRDSFNTASFWQDIDANDCNVTLLVPSMINWLLGTKQCPNDRENGLTYALSAPLTSATKTFAERFGVRFRTLFGMSEAGHPFAGPMGDDFSNLQSCGSVRPGYEVRLVDALDREVPVGEAGELMLRTSTPWTLNQGYIGQPEETLRAWRNGWFHTGDMFRRDAAGRYYFVDRNKDALRRRGENISSFEVEQYFAAHAAVKEVAAVGVTVSEGDEEILVFIVPASKDVDVASLLASVSENMPRHMRPRFAETVDALPKTQATERVRKAQLRARGVTCTTWDAEASRFAESTVQ